MFIGYVYLSTSFKIMFKKTPTKGPVPGSSKSKKLSNKDKERKKVVQQNHGETSSTTTNHDKFTPNQLTPDGGVTYVGFNPETISIISEQFLNEELPDEVCEALAEDISYKMRELLSAASLTMRHSKRTYLKCDDVNSAFKRLNLEPVYGAGLPNWVTFGDPNNYTCNLSKNVDLVELTQADATILEPGDMGLEYRWFKDSVPKNLAGIDSTLKKYCDTVMKLSISKKDAVRNAVLKDVAKNMKIGPIIPAICNFCFLILQKNITYSSLALPVLQLLEAITFNPCTSFSAEEKQITLLIYLLLESIMNSPNLTSEVISTSRVIGRMCSCWPSGSKLVTDKIRKHLPPEPFRRLTPPVISVLSYIGGDALDITLWPHLTEVLTAMRDLENGEKMEMEAALLDAARVYYSGDKRDKHRELAEEFGEKVVPFWDLKDAESCTVQKPDPQNWLQLKLYLAKTLKVQSKQEITNRTSQVNVFFKKSRPIVHRNIQIVGFKSLPIRRKTLEQSVYRSEKHSESVDIVTGRRTLLTLKKQFLTDSINKNNGMMYTI